MNGSLDKTAEYIESYGVNGSALKLKHIAENITIAAAAGNTPPVASLTNLAPAGSLIVGFTFRVIQAPGGGAANIDVGRTNGGNLDEFCDGATCTTLGNTATWFLNHDAATLAPIINTSADTLTFTTNADVSGASLILRVVVWYWECTAPTS
jgi:hypothetical protein